MSMLFVWSWDDECLLMRFLHKLIFARELINLLMKGLGGHMKNLKIGCHRLDLNKGHVLRLHQITIMTLLKKMRSSGHNVGSMLLVGKTKVESMEPVSLLQITVLERVPTNHLLPPIQSRLHTSRSDLKNVIRLTKN